MNRDEILKRSRREKKDEGMEYTENNGRKLGFVVLCFVFIFIVIFNSIMGEENHALGALFWTFIAVESIPKYRFTQNKGYLITIIAGFIAGAISLTNFVLGLVR